MMSNQPILDQSRTERSSCLKINLSRPKLIKADLAPVSSVPPWAWVPRLEPFSKRYQANLVPGLLVGFGAWVIEGTCSLGCQANLETWGM